MLNIVKSAFDNIKPTSLTGIGGQSLSDVPRLSPAFVKKIVYAYVKSVLQNNDVARFVKEADSDQAVEVPLSGNARNLIGLIKSKDFDKTLVTYAVDTRADEIYVISVEKVLHSSFPTMSNVPDKRFHGMFGMMLEENWLKQYDKLPKVGDILPAPKKDKAFEAVEVNEEEIKSDEEFKEYAFKVLKQAFADDFEESKAQEVVSVS